GRGGGGGIRTHGGVTPTAVFKTAALNHSATPPGQRAVRSAQRAESLDARRQPSRSITHFSLCALPTARCSLRQEIHIERDLEPQPPVIANLVEREIQRDADLFHQPVRR